MRVAFRVATFHCGRGSGEFARRCSIATDQQLGDALSSRNGDIGDRPDPTPGKSDIGTASDELGAV